MLHPLFQKKLNLYIYLFVWILIAASHYYLLVWVYSINATTAIIDSLTFNILYLTIGLSFWYVVRFSNIDQKTPFPLLINHFAAACFTIVAWLGIGYLIVNSFEKDFDYNLFFFQSLPWRIFSGVLFYITINMMFYLLIYYLNFQEKVKNESDLRALVKEAELNYLKSQLNPHFIFNSLNSISYLTMVTPEKAQEMIIKLSNFLRYSLNKGESKLTTLQEELDALRLYLEIEKVRFGERLSLVENICSDCLDKKLPHMILQPIFENAIKYGVHQSMDTVTIDVQAAFEESILQLKIANNFDNEAVGKKGKGIGLQNIQNRLRLVYGGVDLVKINKTENHFEVNLFIPQKNGN